MEKNLLKRLVDQCLLINKKKTIEILEFGFLHGDCKEICFNGLYNMIYQSDHEFKKIKNQNSLNLFEK